ncbi:MAG: hypothetical protein N3A54_00570 [Patescibacteria group bacterium]|nr:hypothetical protein [Patescibacteria group bacterium]
MKTFKEYLFEDIEIERKAKEVIATATGKESEYFTKLGKKVLEVQAAQKKLDEIMSELQDTIREDMRKIFSDAADETKTRIVETLSVIIMLSKTPEPRKTVQWKEVVEELMTLLNGLENQIEEIIKKHTKYSEVKPFIRVSPKDPTTIFKEEEEAPKEDPKGDRLKMFFMKLKKWFKLFDLRLMAIKKKIRRYNLFD